MFAALTQPEQTQLFLHVSRAHRALDKRLADLIPSPEWKFRPVMDTAADMIALLHDLNATPAAPEAWQAGAILCRCPEHSAGLLDRYGTCAAQNAADDPIADDPAANYQDGPCGDAR